MSRIVALLPLLLAVAVLACGEDPPAERPRAAEPPAEPAVTSESFPVPLVVAIAADRDGAWVLDDAGALTRLDARGSRVLARRQPASEKRWRDVGALALDGEHLWLADERRGLLRLDARTGRRTARPIRVGRPSSVAVGAGAVWVADRFAGTVRRVDARTLEVSRPVRAGRELAGLAAGDGGVWAADTGGDALVAVDPSTEAVARSAMTAVGTRSGQVVVAGDLVLLADDDGVAAYDPATLRPRARWDATTGASPRVAAGEGAVWAVDPASAALTELDPRTLRVRREIDLPVAAEVVAVAPGAVWVSDVGRVRRITP